MFDFEKISVALSSNPVLFILISVLLIIYAVYVYRYTIPAISKSKKIFLISLRTISILLLLFVFFEPIFSFTKKIEVKPVNLFFVDNSHSIKIKDGTNRMEDEKTFLQNLKNNNIAASSELYSFGDKVKKISLDSLSGFDFSDGETNFSDIFAGINKSNKNISTITIVSDGVITEGTNPLFFARKLNIPVFTVGIGDSTKKNDVIIKSVLFNEFIYSQTPTTILGTIINKGFENKTVTVSLLEEGKIVDQKNMTLSQSGIQNVSMNYTPSSAGEKKLVLSISKTDGEFSTANNKKVFYIKVLSSKIKVLVVAGSPSPDLSFIKNALSQDKNLEINSITQTAPDKFLEQVNKDALLDSADVLFLIDFPTNNTPENLYRKIQDIIIKKDKPFFFLFGSETNFLKLKNLEPALPFVFQQAVSTPYEVQPNIQPAEMNNPIIQNNSQNIISGWNNLPPVQQPDALLTSKPESEILSKIVINNVPVNRPLILTRKLGEKRSVAVLAQNIWRWGLQTANKDSDIFGKFILNSVKWLNNKEEQKQVTIRTGKKSYSTGERIEFNGQVYDESFNPVSSAELNINIKGSGETYNVAMNSIGNGLYQGFLESALPGDYNFTGTARQDGNIIGNDSGKFNIGEMDIEFINTNMDYDFLNSFSNSAGGKFFMPAEQNELFDILKKTNQKSTRSEIETAEFNLWANEWLMSIIIFLFALEWFFRKRFGML